MTRPRTLFEKIWDRHVIEQHDDGPGLLYVDRFLCHEGSHHSYGMIGERGIKVRRPDRVFASPDHFRPSNARDLSEVTDADGRTAIERLARNAGNNGVRYFDPGQGDMGILHVIGPEQGLTMPGIVLCCGDSHTATHGALGCFAFGVGSSEGASILATQAVWLKKPSTMRIRVDGALRRGVEAKDIILAIIGRIGTAGATGHVIEYAGAAIRALPMAARMTVCNMSIEAGARAGMVAPDDTTFAYVDGRPYAPRGETWAAAVAYWRTLPSDDEAVFDREVVMDAADLAPMVTWGTSPEQVAPIDGRVPDPSAAVDAAQRDAMIRALDYMDLTPGTPISDIAVDRVFIGSCTNGRIEDLRTAAAVVRGRKAAVRTLVVAGSERVKAEAEAEGLDRVFKDAGMTWGEAGCSMCVAMNGDYLQPGERSASTSNRNFVGRQGRGGRTHLVGAASAAAAALTGRLTDVRKMMAGA